MTLVLLSFAAGVLTILSPCILPVLPFVFARADRPFLRNGLPMLLGMAGAFAAIASLAAVGGAWAVQANQFGRFAALAILAFFGLTLLWPGLADALTRPLVALGNRLSQGAESTSGIGSSVVLGVATGLLWAPCAGPILGLILTGAALQGANVGTTFLLLAYAIGAATSLAIALLAGGRVFAALKQSLRAGEWIRRGLGAAVLAGVAAVALGFDTGVLTRLAAPGVEQIEGALLRAGGMGAPARAALDLQNLPVEGVMPDLPEGAVWLNSPPLTREQLRGRVVLIDFWTYSCINCLRTLPYVRAWAEKYRDSGLVVIGVHAPEFAFERDEGNVRRAAARLGVNYPVVLDNSLSIWRAFDNHYWPAHYFIDAEGRIRRHHFGEGEYAESEQVIQTLLAEAGHAAPGGLVDPRASGVGVAAAAEVASPETYLGYMRAANFTSPVTRDRAAPYSSAAALQLNQWGLNGSWNVRREHVELAAAPGSIRFRYRARDVHLVLGPGAAGGPVRFRVTIDGRAAGGDGGMDVNAAGEGLIGEERLYQLVRSAGPVRERTFEIEFLDPGVRAFAFTFG